MRQEESRSDLGMIRIHKKVISSIACLAAEEIEGIKKVGPSPRKSFWELFCLKSGSEVKVEFDKNDDVSIKIPLIIKYGYNIPDIASKVQENVRFALEKMTTLSIKDIHVDVKGIEKE